MIKKFLTTAGLTIILIAGLFILRFNDTANQTPNETLSEQSPLDNIDFNQPTPPPLFNRNIDRTRELNQTGWIPDWDFANGFASFKAKWREFDSISPVWYSLTEDGDTKVNRVGYREIRLFTREKGIELIPSIASFNADEFHKILNNDKKLKEHIDLLTSEIDKYDYDGIDLDYESIYLEDQPEFLYLVQQLYAHLDPQGKKLTIAVMPNWTNSDVFRSLRQTREVQNWAELEPYIHELRIMTYNITDYVSRYPGPVSPLDWNNAVLRYARTKIDPHKVLLGINLYGYDGWSNTPVIPEPYLGIMNNPRKNKGQADAVTYTDVLERNIYKVSDKLEKYSQEKLLIYNLEDKEYFVFYQDLTSAKPRFNLARDYGISGVAHWRMGSEDTRIYSLR